MIARSGFVPQLAFPAVRPYPRAAAASAAATAASAAVLGSRSHLRCSLENDLDAIDDLVMDRPPAVGRDKVKVFYEEAIIFLDRGEYDVGAKLLDRAVGYVGEDSRRGGEFKLWLVTALQGVRQDDHAVEVLKRLKFHGDKDVRQVARELLYIAEAPKLALNSDNFVAFPDFDSVREEFDKKGGKYKALRKPRVPYADSYKERKGPAYEVTAYSAPPQTDFRQVGVLVGIIVTLSAATLLVH